MKKLRQRLTSRRRGKDTSVKSLQGAEHEEQPGVSPQPTLSQSNHATLLESAPVFTPLQIQLSKIEQQDVATADGGLTPRELEASSKNQLGLNVVYRPRGHHKADIVFVHGLGGGSCMTWSHNHDPKYFWPVNFLSKEPDLDEARISTFGYNANFRAGSGKTILSILDFAKDLLFELKYAERPIIFIAHSMGGLVVKEAYLQGQNDPAYESIISAISSIIFLSTPHRGTSLAELLNRILQVSFVASPKQFIAELASGSQTLQRLNEQFRHAAPKLNIVSFYETRPTAMFKKTEVMILDKDSSVLGYPGEVSKPLNADHHGVCKYASPDDPCYISVRNILKAWIGEARPSSSLVGARATAGGRNAQSTKFVNYLKVSETQDGDYNFFRDRWTPGTCTWILEDCIFKNWMADTSPSPRIMRVCGSAASGKSITSSFLINHLIQLGLPCSYFFFRFTSQATTSLSLMLRSLACQIAAFIPAYAEQLGQLEAAVPELKVADCRNLWQCLFMQSLLQLEFKRPLYWIIDGVDEADRPGDMVKLLSELRQTKLPLRIMVVSRDTHEISLAFRKFSTSINVDTIQTESNQVDFRTHVDYEIDFPGDEAVREKIISQLLDRSTGNFLWVHLAVLKINSCDTEADVENALRDLPSGMEAWYDRMAASIQSQRSSSDQRLGLDILGWATCARRLLSVDELSCALSTEGFLQIHRTIERVCGGFAIVDLEGKLNLIHETAREYLTRADGHESSFRIDSQATNKMLLHKCLETLTEPTLRNQVNRNQPPALLSYAATAWAYHFSQVGASCSKSLEAVCNFLKGPHVLTWIQVGAQSRNLQAITTASRFLANIGLDLRATDPEEDSGHREARSVIEGWATDLVKVVGKFGSSLNRSPGSIHKLIPPFCPRESMVYQQFGLQEKRNLHVSGAVESSWDDCLARLSLPKGFMASSIIDAGSRIAVLAMLGKASIVLLYNAVTFEEQQRIDHPGRVLSMQVSKLGNLLATYGYLTTRVWDVVAGTCIATIKNPARRPRPHSIHFDVASSAVLVCDEYRCVRSFSFAQGAADEWTILSQVKEETLGDTIVNLPVCSALSPDGSAVAFGYRNHPLTAWELTPPRLLGRCYVKLDERDMTTHDNTYGEVFKLAWHPFSGEVYGLDLVGLLFRWDPFDEETIAKVHCGANHFIFSRDGSLIVTGDAVGTVKVYATADFSLLYALSSQDPIMCLGISADSKRLYDTRGSYCNVWGPDVLMRLADVSDQNDYAQDDKHHLVKDLHNAEHNHPRVDYAIGLEGQWTGSLYCYSTEDGLSMLGKVGSREVLGLGGLANYMPIEQIAWSANGELIALADVSGRLVVKSISQSDDDVKPGNISSVIEIVLPLEMGHICQLVFHPTAGKLLVSSAAKLFSLDLTTRELASSALDFDGLEVKWAWHSAAPKTLLAFGIEDVRMFSWTTLRETGVQTYSPRRTAEPPKHEPTSTGQSARSRERPEQVGRLLHNAESTRVLLQVSVSPTPGLTDNQYLLFDLDESEPEDEESKLGETLLHYTLLPPYIASRIREPLAMISRDRLVFLDVDRWVCSWKMPSDTFAWRAPNEGSTGIEQHYFIPEDWVVHDPAGICTVLWDGTLLFPRNGGVVTVQAAKLKR